MSSTPVTRCSSEACPEPPDQSLHLRDQPGHVHDCRAHAAWRRAWCDVVASSLIVDGACSVTGCTGDESIADGVQPTPLA